MNVNAHIISLKLTLLNIIVQEVYFYIQYRKKYIANGSTVI